jgi:hypothetical protein
MNDPKFSKFEFNKREIKTWENQRGLELTVSPKVSEKGAVSVTEAQEPKYTTASPADHIAPDVLDTGIKFELDKKYGTLDVTPEQFEKCREMAIKNLSKDVLYYVKQDSVQLDAPGEKMEKAKLNEETDALFARNLKAAGYDYRQMLDNLGDAVAAEQGLEDASAEELKIYAQIAQRLGDDIDVYNALDYLESLPNYRPEYTPDNLRKANEAIQNIENDEQTKRRIAGLTNQLLQDADPRDEAVKAYAISVKNDLESGDASRMTQYKDILSLDDLKDDMEHYITHDVDQLEESQYSISDIQNKFPDKAFDIQQAALRAVGARDVQAAYSKSAGEFEQALYRAAHGNLEEDHSADPNDKYVVRPCKNKEEPWAVWEGETRVKGFATKEEAQEFADKKNKEQGLEEDQDFTLTPDEREEKEKEKFDSYYTGEGREALKEMFKKIITKVIND